MTQPDYVPLQESDRIRPSLRLPAPASWTFARPAELSDLRAPSGPRLGSSGSDIGYGLKLARRFEGKLILTEGEHSEDVVAGCFGCGSRRSSHFGRAPVIYDMEWAYALWGYLMEAPEDLVEARKQLFRGAAEHYWDQRRIADAVRPEALTLTPAQAREKVAVSWASLLVV